MMRCVVVSFLCLFFVSHWAACSPNKVSSRSVVIRVGDRSITVEEIQKVVNSTAFENGIPKSLVWSSINGLVNKIVDDSLILEYGKDMGITLEEIELERAIQDIVRDYPGNSFKETLLIRCIDYDEWKQKLREQLLIDKIVKKQNESLSPISHDAIKSYYQERCNEFWHPPRVKLLHIITPTRSDAEAMRARLEGGDDAAELIKEQSLHPEIQVDYGRDWITKDILPQPLAEVAFSLPIDELSDIIKTSYGFHIIKVAKRELSGKKQLIEVIGEIEKALLNSAIEAHYTQWLEQLREEYAISVNYTLLDQVRAMDDDK
jgi:foldase protein PrsA